MERLKLPISAVIVTRNESRHLKACLSGVDYCDDIIVIDLNSTDNCAEIALEFGARVIRHEETPYVELVHQKIHTWVNHKWILLTDPDEVADLRLKQYVMSNFQTWANDFVLGSIRAPMLYYVGTKPFYGTGWGPTNKSRVYLVHLDRYEFSAQIHKGRKLKEGYVEIFIPKDAGTIHHYWVESLTALIRKCRRYLRHESGVLAKDERKNSWQLIKYPFTTFYSSFFVRKGYSDGLLGFVLSVILSWYNTVAYLKKK